MKCPYCQHDFIPTMANIDTGRLFFKTIDHSGFLKVLRVNHIVCPNEECKKTIIDLDIYYCTTPFELDWEVARHRQFITQQVFGRRILPEGISRKYPDYIPQQLRDDYEEACKIVELSPKASATLARRCLQGMIRDFHGICKKRLVDEINALEGEIDPALWDAIDAVRNIGNIGAHMEKDVNIIVDIDPDEARQLIGLIEMLFDEWYVQREERSKRLKAIKALGDQKQAQKRAELN